MFNIEATDEEVTKKKKITLIGLFALFFLVALLGYFMAPNEDVPQQVALADDIPTPTATLQSTATPTESPTLIPTVTSTSTSTPQPTATPSLPPPTPTAVPPTFMSTSTADATTISAVDSAQEAGTEEANGNDFTPNVQTSDEEGVVVSGESSTTNEGEEADTGTSEMESEESIAESGPSEATAGGTTENSTETAGEGDTEATTDDSSRNTGYGPIIRPGAATPSSVEADPEQPSEATLETDSPGSLPTTGIDGFRGGIKWLALGIILVLVGFGVTSANHSTWGN